MIKTNKAINEHSLYIEKEISIIVNKIDNLLLNYRQVNSYLDLTELKTYTIDDLDAHEIDDAISYESNNKRHIFWIHIACPSEFILINSKIEQAAISKASTIYKVQGIQYLFPRKLINDNFSLVIKTCWN